jgi:hypothetical protein
MPRTPVHKLLTVWRCDDDVHLHRNDGKFLRLLDFLLRRDDMGEFMVKVRPEVLE